MKPEEEPRISASSMRRTFRFRLRPNRTQEARMLDVLTLCRRLYNAALEQRIRAYRMADHVSLSLYEQKRELPALKAEFPEFAGVHAHVLQDVMFRLDRNFRAFFRRLREGRRKAGFPRFKPAHRYNSFSFFDVGFTLATRFLTMSRLGEIRIKLHRPIEGKIKTLTIKRDVDRWYAVFAVELPDPLVPDPVPADPVGVDAGLTNLATLSDGVKFGNPRHLAQAEARLIAIQRRLSAKVRGSRNRAKARLRVARAHRRVRDARNDFHHKLSRGLVDRYDAIFVEALNIAGMVRNRHLSKSIADAGWDGLVSKLEYKAASAGIRFGRVPAAMTSQECSSCSRTVPKTLGERTHRCGCGLVIDRDVNAARNILQRGLASLAEAHAVGLERPECTPVERLASTPQEGERAGLVEAGRHLL